MKPKLDFVYSCIIGALVFLSIACGTVAESGVAGAACDKFEVSPPVEEIKEAFQQTAKFPLPLWADFIPTEETMVLTGSTSDGACLLVYRQLSVVYRVELADPIVLGNNLYDFYKAGSNLKLPKDLITYFESVGVSTATVYNLDYKFDSTQPYQLFIWGMSRFNSQTIIHETFHNTAQKWGVKWPMWAIPKERDRINSECYRPNKEIEDLYLAEANALIGAFQLVTNYQKFDLAKQAANDFIATRNKRYKLLALLNEQNNGSKLNCPFAESALELSEGAAQYVGLGYQVFGKKIDPLQLQSRFVQELADDAFYYNFGAMQLMILYQLAGAEKMTEITAHLAKSDNWQNNIFSYMIEWTKK